MLATAQVTSTTLPTPPWASPIWHQLTSRLRQTRCPTQSLHCQHQGQASRAPTGQDRCSRTQAGQGRARQGDPSKNRTRSAQWGRTAQNRAWPARQGSRRQGKVRQGKAKHSWKHCGRGLGARQEQSQRCSVREHGSTLLATPVWPTSALQICTHHPQPLCLCSDCTGQGLQLGNHVPSPTGH